VVISMMLPAAVVRSATVNVVYTFVRCCLTGWVLLFNVSTGQANTNSTRYIQGRGLAQSIPIYIASKYVVHVIHVVLALRCVSVSPVLGCMFRL
jgi:hypothetical protein